MTTGETTRYQYEMAVNPDAHMFRIGYTEVEILALLGSVIQRVSLLSGSTSMIKLYAWTGAILLSILFWYGIYKIVVKVI